MRVRLTILYLVLMALATTWPGALIANRVRPHVFGIPFNFAWYAAWIVGAFVVLLWLDADQQRRERDG